MILDKSLALFAEKGFRSVTMKEICEVCSLSRGGLYGHYDSAEQIFLELLKQLPARKHSAMQKRMAQQDAAPDILDEFVETTLQNIEQNQASLFLAICEFFSDPAQKHRLALMETMLNQGREACISLIRYGQQRGEFRQVDAEGLWLLFMSGSLGFEAVSRHGILKLEDARRAAKSLRSLLVVCSR